MIQHSPEYKAYLRSPEWRDKSKRYRSISNCCLYPKRKPREAHHMTYDNLYGECFWRDVLPLSDEAHKIVHKPFWWNRGKPNHRPRILINFYLRFIGFPIAFVTRMIFG